MKKILPFCLLCLLHIHAIPQNRTVNNIPFRYCCANTKITIGDRTEALLEGFNTGDLSAMVVLVVSTRGGGLTINNIYLTTGAVYPNGNQLKTENMGSADNSVKLKPLNLDRYWQGNRLVLYVSVIYKGMPLQSGSFVIGRGDSRNKESMQALDSICKSNQVPAPRYVEPKVLIQNTMVARGIYPNQDARELLKAFNAKMYSADSVKTTEFVHMPPFPAPTAGQKKAAKKLYKESRKPDAAISGQFNNSVQMLSDGIAALRPARTQGNTQNQALLNRLAEINYYCNGITPYSKKIGRKTMVFLREQVTALHAIITKPGRPRLTDDEIRDCNLLMDNIYMNVKRIAERYRVKPYPAGAATGFMGTVNPDQVFFAASGMAMTAAGPETEPVALPESGGSNDVCLSLTWWERIFRPRTEKRFYVYVFKCPDAACAPGECTNEKGCFNGCENQYTIIATCLGASPEVFQGKASVAYNTLTDAKWTFNIYKGTNTNVSPVKTEEIYTSTATCETNKKQLQIWLKLLP